MKDGVAKTRAELTECRKKIEALEAEKSVLNEQLASERKERKDFVKANDETVLTLEVQFKELEKDHYCSKGDGQR